MRRLRKLACAGIHVFKALHESKAWMAGTSPAVTTFVRVTNREKTTEVFQTKNVQFASSSKIQSSALLGPCSLLD
ncbi:MAG: hypothetical protein WAL48_12220, partial [Xanthobacteraceae bacterium]